MRAILALACALFLSACAHQAPVQTTIPAAMAGIQSSLTHAGVVSITRTDDARLNASIQAAQCAQNTPDPVVGIITGDVTLQLSGTFTQGGSFSVNAAGSVPTFGLQGDADKTRSQTITLPVSYAPVSHMPDIEMGRMVGYETAIFAQPDDARRDEAKRLIAEREALRQKISEVIKVWNPALCESHEHLSPIMSIHR